MQIVRSLNLGKDRIVLIAYRMYSSGKNAFVKYEDGNRSNGGIESLSVRN